ncbi:diacylglycerol kinase family protein [Brevundimonas sp.]|uniref:diacylglycerol kinase family protein n=1 Tax=Brevundimonas sp. TaxID=1871086 RepID=UPI0025F81CDF|nr:diacylglycerol kinase family protein [Brevundimonas sp.]
MSGRGFSILGRLKSFRYALAGLLFVLRTQHNAWLHLIATLGVAGAAVALRVEPRDWLWLIAAVAVVWVAEITNTAFEHLCDVVSPELHSSVQRAKDVAAAAVLVAAIAAAIIGGIVFWPYLAGVA